MLCSSPLHSPYCFNAGNYSHSSTKTLQTKAIKTLVSVRLTSDDSAPNLVLRRNSDESDDESTVLTSFCCSRLCVCGRRHFIEASAASLLPIFPSKASDLQSDAKAMLKKVHPPRPDWYENLYASLLESAMKPYEAEVSDYKANLFTNLKGKTEKVLELGIGTGPNLKYYANDASVSVFGIDPNKVMEKYAQEAAVAAGLPLTNFKFIQAVGETLPFSDASMDAVIGTLVLCSVKDVAMTLNEIKRVLKPGGLYLFMEHVAAKDGTALRFLQGFLDPLQQTLSDGCHFTRETGNDISEAGFSGVDLKAASFPRASILTSPHVYGVACK